jgi:broad specificity phosphatase PhoE
LEGRYQGQSDVPLDENGRAQALIVAVRLQTECFSGIYCSDLKRTIETADIIGKRLHLPITLEPRLREIDQGEWEGQLVDEIKVRYTRLWQERFIDPVNIRPPGGETLGEVATRVSAALDSLVRLRPGVPVLIVSHGLALATAVCRALDVPLAQAYSRIPRNTEPVWIDWRG